MRKLILFLLLLLFLFPVKTSFATEYFVVASGFIGGTSGKLDAIECEDIESKDPPGTPTAITTGSIALVVDSNKVLAVYRYNASGTDSEDATNYTIIVPDDRATDCSGNGQWEKVEDFYPMTSVTIFDSSANKMTFSIESALGADKTWKFPGVGSANQIFQSDGDGTFTWVADDDQPEAGDYESKSIDGDDVNNNIAGRSLTMNTSTSPDSIEIDDEIYTQEKCVYIEDPTIESFNNLFWWMYNVTIVYVRCETDTGTADINIEDGSDNNILTAELVCDVGGQTSCASGCDVNTISDTYDNITGKTEPVDLDISATASSPTVLIVCIGYEVDSQ